MAQGLPVPAQRQAPAQQARPRAAQVPRRHLHQRLLLARPPRLPQVREAKNKCRFLEGEDRPHRGRIEADLRAAKQIRIWTGTAARAANTPSNRPASIMKFSPKSKPSWACRKASAATRKRRRRKNKIIADSNVTPLMKLI